jgi:hypothetical protein
MFDYKQRPWSRPLTDEEYDRAVGRVLLPMNEETSREKCKCGGKDKEVCRADSSLRPNYCQLEIQGQSIPMRKLKAEQAIS